MTYTQLTFRSRHGMGVLICATALSVVGCQSTTNPPQQDVAVDPFDSVWRRRGSATTPFGLDARAREIEKNLGVE